MNETAKRLGRQAAYGHGNPEQGGESGMTKREAFAMAAMQGLCAWGSDENWNQPIQSAPYAVKWADALLEELCKEENE